MLCPYGFRGRSLMKNPPKSPLERGTLKEYVEYVGWAKYMSDRSPNANTRAPINQSPPFKGGFGGIKVGCDRFF
jgi:hypothetical protein